MSNESTLTVELLRKIKSQELPDSLDFEELQVMKAYIDDDDAFKKRVKSRIKELEEEQEKKALLQERDALKEKIQRAYERRDFEFFRIYDHEKHLSRKQRKTLIAECKEVIIDYEREVDELKLSMPSRNPLKVANMHMHNIGTRYRNDTIVKRNLIYIDTFATDRKEMASVCEDLLQETESYSVVCNIIHPILAPGLLTSEMVPYILEIAEEYQEPRFLEFLLEYDARFLEKMTSRIMDIYFEIFDEFAKGDTEEYDRWHGAMVKFLIDFSRKYPERTEKYAHDILERITNGILIHLHDELMWLGASAKDLVLKLETSEEGESLLSFLVTIYYYIVKGEKLEKSFFVQLEEMISTLELMDDLHAHSLYGALNLYRTTRSSTVSSTVSSIDFRVEEDQKVEKCKKILKQWYAQVSKIRNPEEFLPLLDALDSLTNRYRAIGDQFPPDFLEEKAVEIVTIIEEDLLKYTQKQLLVLFPTLQCGEQVKLDRLRVLRSRLEQECKRDPVFCLELFELSDESHPIMNRKQILNAMSDENPVEAGV